MIVAARRLGDISTNVYVSERHNYMIYTQGRMLSWLINGFSQPLYALRDIVRADGS